MVFLNIYTVFSWNDNFHVKLFVHVVIISVHLAKLTFQLLSTFTVLQNSCPGIPPDRRGSPCAGLMLGDRLRRWPGNNPVQGERLVFARIDTPLSPAGFSRLSSLPVRAQQKTIPPAPVAGLPHPALLSQSLCQDQIRPGRLD